MDNCFKLASTVFGIITLLAYYTVGPFDIPAYDPSHTCSEMTTSTTAVTPTSTTAVTPTSTGIPNHTHGSKHTRVDIEIGVTLGMIFFLVVMVISYCIFKWLVQIHAYIWPYVAVLPVHYMYILYNPTFLWH